MFKIIFNDLDGNYIRKRIYTSKRQYNNWKKKHSTRYENIYNLFYYKFENNEWIKL